MSNITLDEMVPLLSREASTKRSTLLKIFLVVSLLFLVAAMFTNKKYTSSVQLYVDDSSKVTLSSASIQTGNNKGLAEIAGEELFSADILDEILDRVGFVASDASPVEREREKERIIDSTEFNNISNKLIEIKYENKNPAVAHDTTKLFADLFLEKTVRKDTGEATEAFEFLVAQVEAHRAKLEDAEGRLEVFRIEHPGVTMAVDNNVSQRIVDLRRQIEEANLKFAEFDQRRRSLEREVAGQKKTMSMEYEASLVKERVASLQAQIDVLRRSYTDDYPDIVSLKEQMKETLAATQRNQSSGQSSADGGSSSSPVFLQLLSDLAKITAEAESQASRRRELNVLLQNELGRSKASGRVERDLTELTRDYETNTLLYQKSLEEMEAARAIMSLSQENQSQLYRISQPANFPVLPTGLRFIHIAAIGMLLAMVLPFIFLVLFLKLDPRIRTASAITDVLELPLLSTVPHMPQANEKPSFFSKTSTIVAVVILVILLYIVAAFVKNMIDTAAQGGSVL